VASWLHQGAAYRRRADAPNYANRTRLLPCGSACGRRHHRDRFKTSIRLVSNDLRQARQKAVSTYRPTMVSFGTTVDEKFAYFVYDWDAATSTWVQQKIGYLEPETALANRTVYFADIGYADTQPVGSLDGRPDIIFLTNGSVRNPPVTPTLKIKTDVNIPKKEYLVTVSPSGSVKVQ
jgi:hypothetical protein